MPTFGRRTIPRFCGSKLPCWPAIFVPSQDVSSLDSRSRSTDLSQSAGLEAGSGRRKADLIKLVSEGNSNHAPDRFVARSGCGTSPQTRRTASASRWTFSGFRSSEGMILLEADDGGGDLCRREESAGVVCLSTWTTETDLHSSPPTSLASMLRINGVSCVLQIWT